MMTSESSAAALVITDATIIVPGMASIHSQELSVQGAPHATRADYSRRYQLLQAVEVVADAAWPCQNGRPVISSVRSNN